jgi:RimJ/RimL family protein N-acetyltransferase
MDVMMRYPNLLNGELVRLTAEEPDLIAEMEVKWSRNSEYVRLLESWPARLFSRQKYKEWLDKWIEGEPGYGFGIRTLEGDRLIGQIGLDGVDWTNGDAFVGIAIGERDDWGRGYGTDAMRVLVRYAFLEMNLRRLSLTVFEYNPRAVRSYEKVGYKIEGRQRGALNREGRRWDIIFMGILRDEWLPAEFAAAGISGG